MHSDNTLSRPCPSSQLCLNQRGTARHQHKPNGSCVRMESLPTALPFPKDLEMADYRAERVGGCGTSSPHQVYAEEVLHPSYSWGDVRPWDWPLDSPHTPCTCVREIRRDCGCIQRWYYPEHTFNGCHVPPHLKVRGQRYYREILYITEQHHRGHGDADLQDSYNGRCQRRRVSFQNHEERLGGPETSRQSSPNKPQCNGTNSGQMAFFPTEVPLSKLGRFRAHGPMLKVNEPGWEIRTSQGGESLGNHGNQRKSRGTVREQIHQVVTELEEVLGGLKQVQLEMKEVVQQIDILTSNIDLNEDKASPSSGHWSSRTAGVTSVDPESQSDTTPETSDSSIPHLSVSEDSVDINPAVMRNHTSSSPPNQRLVTAEINCSAFVQQISSSDRSTSNGTCLPHRTAKVRANRPHNHKGQLENHERTKNTNHRPPPYPQNGQVKTQTHPCPGKHKTLSSTVV